MAEERKCAVGIATLYFRFNVILRELIDPISVDVSDNEDFHGVEKADSVYLLFIVLDSGSWCV